MIYHLFANVFVQFSFQLFISEVIFMINIPRKKYFVSKILIGLAIQIFLSYVLQVVVISFMKESLFPLIIMYFGNAVLSVIPMLMGFDIEGWEIIFILTGGYATEHMIFAISRIMIHILHQEYALYGSLIHLLITRYLIYMIGAGIVYFFVVRIKNKENTPQDSDFRIIILALVITIFAIGFSVYWSYSEEYYGTVIGDIICPAYSVLCCTLALFMEYYVLRENSMKRDKKMMEQLLQIAGTQQKSSKEAIDIINIKCHDLKHQIKALAKIEDYGLRNDYLQEIREAVSIYDSTYHTGCSALDYVLQEKTLIFNERKIAFSCMVEGEMITYMSPTDVYALMGNALDNALERVLKESEKERVISFQIKHHYEMVLIHLENRCSSNLKFVDGIPVTDKKDKVYHGFGVKSMQYIVSKYNGELFMTLNNGKFSLDMLFPLDKES